MTMGASIRAAHHEDMNTERPFRFRRRAITVPSVLPTITRLRSQLAAQPLPRALAATAELAEAQLDQLERHRRAAEFRDALLHMESWIERVRWAVHYHRPSKPGTRIHIVPLWPAAKSALRQLSPDEAASVRPICTGEWCVFGDRAEIMALLGHALTTQLRVSEEVELVVGGEGPRGWVSLRAETDPTPTLLAARMWAIDAGLVDLLVGWQRGTVRFGAEPGLRTLLLSIPGERAENVMRRPPA